MARVIRDDRPRYFVADERHVGPGGEGHLSAAEAYEDLATTLIWRRHAHAEIDDESLDYYQHLVSRLARWLQWADSRSAERMEVSGGR